MIISDHWVNRYEALHRGRKAKAFWQNRDRMKWLIRSSRK